VTLRKVPGALALGLLASLVAHGGLFGREHSMGGDYHGLLLQLALAAGAGLLFFFGSVAWKGARAAVDGSILASRLGDRLPGFASVCAASMLWYALAECAEPHHAVASWIAVPLFLAAASWLVRLAARAALAVLAGAILAVFRHVFAARTPSWSARATQRRPVRRVLWTRRRFARPPPVGFGCCA
jgi:hypothetical protein